MPGSHAPYPPEFRRQMVELVRSGRSVEELAREFEPSAGAIRNWVKQNHVDTGKTPGVTTEEKQRVLELEKENRELRRANEILRKASAYFAQAELDRR